VSGSGDVTQQVLFYVTPDAKDQASLASAASMSARRGGQLPVIRTKAEFSDLLLLLHYSKHFQQTHSNDWPLQLGNMKSDKSFPKPVQTNVCGRR
jgi:hypothetical protein